MLTVVQRVQRAEVRVDGSAVGTIGQGLMLLVGVERGDTAAEVRPTVDKIAGLRVFPGRTPFDQSVEEVGGGCLVVSQFTLAGSVKKGRRPGFDRAEDPKLARPLYEAVAQGFRDRGIETATGSFGAHMDVDFVNDGPVTLIVRALDGRIQDL